MKLLKAIMISLFVFVLIFHLYIGTVFLYNVMSNNSKEAITIITISIVLFLFICTVKEVYETL